MHSYKNLKGNNNFENLLKARHECASELGGGVNMSCNAFNTCLRTKGWIELKDTSGIVVPSEYRVPCKRTGN
tara:strand:- start:289 stop:504 length:216 start_codon:yes stop_codon:yes gene_type:complete